MSLTVPTSQRDLVTLSLLLRPDSNQPTKDK